MLRELLEQYQRTGQLVRAAMYLRKSRMEQHLSREETLEKHRAALTAYADRYGYQVDPKDVYEEVVSGESLFGRPQMLRLLEAVTAGQYEAVLCMDMQRLGRGGMYDQGIILDTFKSTETLIVTPERLYDLSKELDEQAAEMETFLSRGEYRLITKRLQRGTLQTLEHGAYLSNAPFGYRQVRQDRLPTLEIVPEEANCVRQIFQLYADGMGCTKIEQTINAQGFRGRRGSRFNRNTIRLILENPVYIGKVRWNKTSKVKRGIGADRQVKTIYNKKEDWRIIDGRHPPIITEELWNQVQARRQSRYFYVDNKHIASPLAGLVHCSKCGRKMNMQGKNKGVAYLLCPTPGCSAGVKFDLAEEAVYRQLTEMTTEIEVEAATAAPPNLAPLQQALENAQDQVKRLDDRRNRLYSFLEDGTYSKAVFSERMQALSTEETALQASISSLNQRIQTERARDKQKQLEALHTVLDHYNSSTLAEKKQLLQSVITDILYSKEKKSKPGDFSISITLNEFF